MFNIIFLQILLLGSIAVACVRISQKYSLCQESVPEISQMSLTNLKKSSHFLKLGEKEAFYEEVLRALWGYLSDKLSTPVSELSKDNAGDILNQSNASAEVIQEIMDILDTCEFARYAPASGTGEMDQLYNKTIATISKLENQLKR